MMFSIPSESNLVFLWSFGYQSIVEKVVASCLDCFDVANGAMDEI